jgi:NAD(P)-dependent dehydrogenase (short-subunit alcohol dehydrogenase family)
MQVTKAVAKELGRFNISVNAVCPGFIPTDLNLVYGIRFIYRFWWPSI